MRRLAFFIFSSPGESVCCACTSRVGLMARSRFCGQNVAEDYDQDEPSMFCAGPLRLDPCAFSYLALTASRCECRIDY